MPNTTLSTLRWMIPLLALVFASQLFAHGMSDAEKQAIIEGGNLRYIWIGATHMLSGYDHLAFVFGIVFFLTRFSDIVKYITAFTIGHSITLIIATFMGIKINYFLIDAVIALSVCYIALVNLDWFKQRLNINPPNMLAMIFGLGLIHGLGLSTRLQQLPLDPDNLLMNIISFNVGIELGQIAALAVMLLVITVLRKSAAFPAFSRIANYALLALGAFLFLSQMHGYDHSTNAEEYASNAKHSPAAKTQTQQVIAPVAAKSTETAEATERKDTIKIAVPTGGEIEYKLMLADKASFEYAWKTNQGKLYFDFHGEPKGDTSGYFESFKIATESQSSGSLTTSFAGTHGWYWKNDNAFDVEVTLDVSGNYERMDGGGAK